MIACSCRTALSHHLDQKRAQRTGLPHTWYVSQQAGVVCVCGWFTVSICNHAACTSNTKQR